PWVMCATAVLFLHTAIDAATSPLSSVTLNARLVLVPHIPKAGNATTVGAVTSVGHDGGPSPTVEHVVSPTGAFATRRPVASSSAAPASSTPQPIVSVQPVPEARRADCFRM